LLYEHLFTWISRRYVHLNCGTIYSHLNLALPVSSTPRTGETCLRRKSRYKQMMRVPNSAIEYGNCGPGQVMNIREVDICRRCESAMTLDGSKAALTIIRSIVISGNASSRILALASSSEGTPFSPSLKKTIFTHDVSSFLRTYKIMWKR